MPQFIRQAISKYTTLLTSLFTRPENRGLSMRFRKASKSEKMKITKRLLTSLLITTHCSAFAGEKITLDIQGSHETFSKLGKLTSVKKDNFEKTTEFTKRLCEQTYKALGISEKASITIGLERKEDANIRYNADKQVFVFRFEGGNHYLAGDGLNDSFRWNTSFDPFKHNGFAIAKEYREVPDTYSGANAFGASKEIKVGAKTAAVLYFPHKKRFPEMLEIVFPSRPEEARRIEKDLRVAVITRLQPPCFVSGQGHKPPTMDYPYNLTLSEVGIVGAQSPEWVIYLDSTKEILKRGKLMKEILR